MQWLFLRLRLYVGKSTGKMNHELKVNVVCSTRHTLFQKLMMRVVNEVSCLLLSYYPGPIIYHNSPTASPPVHTGSRPRPSRVRGQVVTPGASSCCNPQGSPGDMRYSHSCNRTKELCDPTYIQIAWLQIKRYAMQSTDGLLPTRSSWPHVLTHITVSLTTAYHLSLSPSKINPIVSLI